MTTTTTVLHLCAPNDRNGNPRRAFVGFAGSLITGAWEEGYKGCAAVPAELQGLADQAPRINVSASELRSWLQAAKEVG